MNVGGVELAAWMSGRIALWHDALEREVAELLTGAAVRTSARAFGGEHFSSAVSDLNRQTLGGAVFGSSRPILIAAGRASPTSGAATAGELSTDGRDGGGGAAGGP